MYDLESVFAVPSLGKFVLVRYTMVSQRQPTFYVVKKVCCKPTLA